MSQWIRMSANCQSNSRSCELKNGSTAQKLRQLLFKPTIFFFCWFLPTRHSHSPLLLILFLFKPLSTHAHTHTHTQTSITSLLNYPLNNQVEAMDKRRPKKSRASKHDTEEVSSIEWEFINMTEQEEDLIYRMYRLVGANWRLIAGRIPGRKAEEIERFWLMRHDQAFAERRNQRN